MPLRDLVLHVAQLLGRRVRLAPLRLWPAAALAGAWHRLGLPPRISAEQVRRLGEDEAVAFDHAARDLGYAPCGYREGLAEEVRRLRETGLIGLRPALPRPQWQSTWPAVGAGGGLSGVCSSA